jgi:hypothetical protein
MKKSDEALNKKAVSFFRAFIRKVLNGKFQVVQFGWWRAGFNGKYMLSLSWQDVDEAGETLTSD